MKKEYWFYLLAFAAGFAACWFFAPNSNQQSGNMPVQGNSPSSVTPSGILFNIARGFKGGSAA